MEIRDQHEARLGYTIEQVTKVSGVGRSTIYEELATGKLQARKLGRRTVILAADLSSWLSNLPLLKP